MAMSAIGTARFGHDIDARLDRDLDAAKWYGVVQIFANVPDIDAELEPSGPLPW